MKYFYVYYFWEEQKTDLQLRGKHYIVSRESAAPTHYETEAAGISADHTAMVQFEDASSQDFRTVIDALRRYSQQASETIMRRRFHENEADQQIVADAMETIRQVQCQMLLPNGPAVPPFEKSSSLSGITQSNSAGDIGESSLVRDYAMVD